VKTFIRNLFVGVLLLVASIVQATDVVVEIAKSLAKPTANEDGLATAEFILTRSGATTTSLTVKWQISVSSTATSADYDLRDSDGNLLGTTLAIPSGSSSATIVVKPKQDTLIEGRETVSLQLVATADYNLNGKQADSIIIADDDLTVNLALNVSSAAEDSPSPPATVRAVLSPSAPPARNKAMDVVVRLDNDASVGHAKINDDFDLTYRIGGSPGIAGVGETVVPRYAYLAGTTSISVTNGNTQIPAGATIVIGTDSYSTVAGLNGTAGTLVITPALNTPVANDAGVAVTPAPVSGFKVAAAAVQNAESISVKNGNRSIPAGSTLMFPGDTTAYTTITGLSGTSGTLSITPPLVLATLSIDVAITVTPQTVTGFKVSLPNNIEPAGTTTLVLSNGTASFAAGDVFRIGSNPQFYVVTDWTSGTKTLEFQRVSDAGGTVTTLTGEPAIVTVFPVTFESNGTDINLSVPTRSSHIDYFFTPKNDTVVEGREVTSLALITNTDYKVISGTTADVSIIDNDATVEFDLTGCIGATKGGTDGQFRVKMKPAGGFPRTISVPVLASGTATSGVDYTALAVLQFEPGSTIAEIPVHALSTANDETLTLTLIPTDDYRLATNAGSPVNATATIDLKVSQGIISLAPKTGFTAGAERPATAIQVPAMFTVKLATGVTTADQTVFFSIDTSPANSGTPNVDYTVPGTDYVAKTGSVVIPSGASSVDIVISPKDDTTPELPETVTLTLTSGPGYLIDSTKKTAAVTILDDEPILSITKTANIIEGDSNVVIFTVTSLAPVPRDTVVDLAYTGTAAIDDRTGPATVEIKKDATTATVKFSATDDGVAEGAETIIATIVDKPSVYFRHPTDNSATTNVTDLLPTLTLTIDRGTTEGSATHGRFKITSSIVPAHKVTVAYTVSTTASNIATPGAAAGAGIDYKTLSGTVDVEALDTYIDVEAFTDNVYDPLEKVVITLTDVSPPTFTHAGTDPLTATMTILDKEIGVLSVTSSTNNGIYKAIGTPIAIAVTFTGDITVTGTGIPELRLETGVSDAIATYVNLTASNTLNFTYSVRATDISDDLDYVSSSALTVTGGSIHSASAPTELARLTLPPPGTAGSLSDNKDIKIDGGNSEGKPAPGSVGSASGGGCGLGSGFAALASLFMLAGLVLSVRRIRA
jgi:Calx-beta domain